MPRPATQPDVFRPTNSYKRVAWKPQRDGGYLLVFGQDRIELYANYASEPPWAAQKTAETRRWQRVFGSWRFELSDVAAQVRHYRLEQDAARARGVEPRVRPRMEAYAKLLDTIDPTHLSVVERYSHRTFQIYVAIRRCPGLFELLSEHGDAPELAGGGALGYALANLPLMLDPRPTHPLRTARRLLKRKRKDIAVALGFPAETAAIAVRVLGRIPSRDVGAEVIRNLRSAFLRGDARTLKLLAHARRINPAVAQLVQDTRVVEWLTPALLHEIAHIDDWTEADVVVQLARDTGGMLERHRPRMPQVRSVAELVALHEAEIERRQHDPAAMVDAARLAIGGRGGYRGGNVLMEHAPQPRLTRGGWDDVVVQLPPAPVPELPGQIEYVSSPEALGLEGRRMHNCVGSYASRVAEGDCFVYRVLAPERCTLSIALGRDRRFRIAQIHTACNGRVQRATEQVVERWLRTHHDPVAVERVRELMAQSASAQLSRYIAADDEAAYQEAACPF